MFETIRTTRADKVVSADIVIKKGMVPYGNWGWLQHLQWVSELSGLSLPDLIEAVGHGGVVLTDESVSSVWLVSSNSFKDVARLVYEEGDDYDS